MTTSGDDGRRHESWRELVTLLPTGVLDQPERTAVRAHLRECPRCRDEFIELADVPGLLARLRESPPPGVRPEPDPSLKKRFAALVAHERSRRRQRRHLFALAASVVLLLPLAFGLTALPDDDTAVAMTTLPAAEGLTASASVDERAWGTALTVQIDGDAPVDRLKVVVWDHTGDRQVVGWWGTDTGGHLRCDGATSFVVGDLARVAVQDADDRELLKLDY